MLPKREQLQATTSRPQRRLAAPGKKQKIKARRANASCLLYRFDLRFFHHSHPLRDVALEHGLKHRRRAVVDFEAFGHELVSDGEIAQFCLPPRQA